MMFSTRSAAFFLLLGGLAANSLFAGAGGVKRTAKISVINDSSVLVGVTSDANSTAIDSAITDASLTEFTNAGGVLVNVGGTLSNSVPAGTYTIGAIDTNFDGLITTTVSIGNGESITIYIIADTSTTATIQFSLTSSTSSSSTSSSSSSTSSDAAATNSADSTAATSAAVAATPAVVAASSASASAAGSTNAAPMAVAGSTVGANANNAAAVNQAANAAFAAAKANNQPKDAAKKKNAPQKNAAKPAIKRAADGGPVSAAGPSGR